MTQSVRLRTLGTLVAECDAGPLTGAATQRKPLALLALLAVAGSRGVSREKLFNFFWPEADTDRAGHGLAQMLYSLRRNFGDGEIVLGTTTLSLNPVIVASDVAEFGAAFGRGDLERAVAVYQGPFLDGVYLKDAPLFERWAEEERSRLAERYRAALEGLATQAGARGDHEASVSRWRQVAAVDPLSTAAALGLMRALAAAGDVAGALHYAHVHETLVRQELESELDPAVTALCAELRTRESSDVGAAAAPAGAGIARAERTTSRAPPALLQPAPTAALPLGAEGLATTTPASSGRRWAPRLVIAGAAVLLLLLAGMMWTRRQPQSSTLGSGLDANRIVILPFRVTSTDSSLSYLSEGLVDLLAATMTGEGGPVAVDPRTTLALWRRATAGGEGAGTNGGEDPSLRVARASGAGMLLRGEIVRASGTRLLLSGVIVRVADGKVRARATVQGQRDSLPALVDRLAGELLTLLAGEGVEHLGLLTTTSLPALRAYLEGRAAHRRGDDRAAVAHLSRALLLDSTFALAGLELVGAAEPIFKWTIFLDSSMIVLGQPSALGGIPRDDDERVTWALDRAWQGRDRLTERDRAYLVALRGENYPLETSAARLLAGWERATRVAPDRADAWYQLGYILLTQGPSLGLAGARERAAAVFHQARKIDSGFVAPIAGLLEIAAFARDRDEVQRLGALYLARDSASERAQYIRWRVAAISGDTTALSVLRGRFEDFGPTTLDWIQRTSQVDGGALEDAERATAAMLRRAAGREQRRGALMTAIHLALNRGRPRDALKQLKLKLEVEGTPTVYLSQCINFALYWEGDSSAGADAARQLETEVEADGMSPHPTLFKRQRRIRSAYVWAQWRLWHGDTATASRLLLLMRSASPADTFPGHAVRTAMIAAEVAVVARQANSLEVVDHLDALALEGCCSPAQINLVVGHLRELMGDVPGALRAVRRGAWSSPWYLSTYLREEGRLAALTGDREGAIQAYRHFLVLRTDPEPSRLAETEMVRAELRRLEQRPK